jgi:FkbM family methyltransferase
LGLTRRLRYLIPAGPYEDAFGSAVVDAVQKGDCVWDVGANVGFYTAQLSERTGAVGRVIAFEPSQVNRVRLAEAVSRYPNVTILPMALGSTGSRAALQQGDDPLGACTRIVASIDRGELDRIVEIVRADDLVVSGQVPQPNVVKIDTEGFELDVLEGMREVALSHADLRVIGVEIHFGLLEERGLPHAPEAIEDMLQRAGFKISWPDFSHVIASRQHL